MKKIIYILLVLIPIIAGIYYYYNFIETVTSYIRIEYTPPVEDPFFETKGELAKMVSNRYSEPSVKFSFVNFENDSVAYANTYANCKSEKKFITDQLSKIKYPETKSLDETQKAVEIMKYQAQFQAYNELLHRQTIILSFAHVRSLDYKKFLNDIIKIGFDKNKIDEYMNKEKVTFKWIDVY